MIVWRDKFHGGPILGDNNLTKTISPGKMLAASRLSGRRLQTSAAPAEFSRPSFVFPLMLTMLVGIETTQTVPRQHHLEARLLQLIG